MLDRGIEAVRAGKDAGGVVIPESLALNTASVSATARSQRSGQCFSWVSSWISCCYTLNTHPEDALVNFGLLIPRLVIAVAPAHGDENAP